MVDQYKQIGSNDQGNASNDWLADESHGDSVLFGLMLAKETLGNALPVISDREGHEAAMKYFSVLICTRLTELGYNPDTNLPAEHGKYPK